jgi:threonine dehydratase
VFICARTWLGSGVNLLKRFDTMDPMAQEVQKSRERLAQYLRPTRLLRAESLQNRSGARVFLKMETDLPTHSFKPRGALNALLTTNENGPLTGVVAASTGNHGAAVAYGAGMVGVSATIFLPKNPNPVKRARILSLGAEVIESESDSPSGPIEGAKEFARQRGYYLLDDATEPLVAAGTATIAAELFDEMAQLDTIFVPMGDTALIRGVAAEAKRRRPEAKIIGVQADRAPAYVRSWQQGKVVVTQTCDTIADGLATLNPSEANVRDIRQLVDEVRLVSEQEMLNAIRLLLLDEHIVAEPAGAAATAAFLQGTEPYVDGTVVLLVTGANVSPDVLHDAVRRGKR